jgi:tetratricopeptide (TPR) repeat protein
MKGNYDKAVSSFRKCRNYSNNDDLKVITINWLFASYVKIGNRELAEALVATISSRMPGIIEDESRGYHDLIMLYGGYVTPRDLMDRNSADANVGYGIGNYYLLEGNIESAMSVFNRIMGTDQKDAIGYIAVEAELANLTNSRL